MKLSIDGKEYSLKTALSNPSLNDLYALKLSTGIGVKSLKLRMKRIDKLKDFEDLFEDLELIDAIRSLVWLARRNAGEQLTLDEANASTIEWIPEADDEVAADPTKALTDSDPAGGAAAPAAKRRRSTKTSTT